MPNTLLACIQNLIRKAPQGWLAAACESLRVSTATATAEFVSKRLPETNNADLSSLMLEVIRHADGALSWEALSWSIKAAFDTYRRLQREQQIELLWSGPSPADCLPARRIDQALYDLIARAKREVLLVTFAAAKIERLSTALRNAAQRGVKIKLVLEFAEASEGQLTFDALKAFPADLVAAVEVYYWPVERRERNQAGKPGKLHAKLAVVDDVALVSSANLTDDAFSRNLELGVMIKDTDFLRAAKTHFDILIRRTTLAKVPS